jgi:HEAT repeat protein
MHSLSVISTGKGTLSYRSPDSLRKLSHPEGELEPDHNPSVNVQIKPPVVREMMTRSSERRTNSAGKEGTEAGLDSLERQLAHDDSEVRWNAVIVLEEIPGSRATELLIRALRDEQFISIRYQAAVVLGTRGDRSAIGPLAAALDDPEFRVREKAAEALGKLDGTEAVEALLEGFEGREPAVQRMIVRALIGIGPPAEDRLRRAQESPEPSLRRAAGEALGEIEATRKLKERVQSDTVL